MFIEVYKKHYDCNDGLKGQIVNTDMDVTGYVVNSEFIRTIEICGITFGDVTYHKIVMNTGDADFYITDADYQKLICLKQEK